MGLELIVILDNHPTCDLSHKPGGMLQLLPIGYLPSKHSITGQYEIILLGTYVCVGRRPSG